MDAVHPTDTLLPVCAALIFVMLLAMRVTALRRNPWNTGDTVALIFVAGLCLAIAFPSAVLIAV